MGIRHRANAGSILSTSARAADKPSTASRSDDAATPRSVQFCATVMRLPSTSHTNNKPCRLRCVNSTTRLCPFNGWKGAWPDRSGRR